MKAADLRVTRTVQASGDPQLPFDLHDAVPVLRLRDLHRSIVCRGGCGPSAKGHFRLHGLAIILCERLMRHGKFKNTPTTLHVASENSSVNGFRWHAATVHQGKGFMLIGCGLHAPESGFGAGLVRQKGEVPGVESMSKLDGGGRKRRRR